MRESDLRRAVRLHLRRVERPKSPRLWLRPLVGHGGRGVGRSGAGEGVVGGLSTFQGSALRLTLTSTAGGGRRQAQDGHGQPGPECPFLPPGTLQDFQPCRATASTACIQSRQEAA